VDKTMNVVEFYYPEEIVDFEREFIEAERAAYMETAIEDDDIGERMDRGRWRCWQGRAQRGRAVPEPDGGRHAALPRVLSADHAEGYRGALIYFGLFAATAQGAGAESGAFLLPANDF
jgi:hypothetical protein